MAVYLALLRAINVGGHNKLTNVVIEKKLGVTGSGRNWNSVTKLREMIQKE
ncbi:DUF1697 domain-containing protein [Kiloniella laminariae]|uniref:DUF1697 domain-containing protein n=1 Tax=Kiloniella laminariae TaxID=454162 RepID=A0ABT4LEL9_9PROT|nr:DUF1697 domain-containing protein [Kiloniella laminariae]MCZ4279553.1 DUF1697 domain-containing protein [Kiloniella laminariae]